MENTTTPTGVRRRAVLPLAAVLVAAGALTPASTAVAAEPSSLITSTGYVQSTEAVGPGLTLMTFRHPTDERIVQVLRADPDVAPLTVESTMGTASGVLERTTDMLNSTTTVVARRPHAGINGGFFAGATHRTDMPTGIAVQEGVVQAPSCAVPKLAEAVLIQHGRPYIGHFTTHLSVSAGDGATMPLDGVNRSPGWMPRCAQGAGATADTTITGSLYADASEIVSFTPEYKRATPLPGDHADITHDDDPGAEAVVDASGTVVSLRTDGRGGATVPAGGKVLQGIGTGADWLRAHATVGAALTVDQRLRDETFGEDIPLDASVDVLNGHYVLTHDAVKQSGLDDTVEAPRSVIAVDGPGRTLFVAVTGKTTRAGVTVNDLADIMVDLGAVDALNMDGGGSTTLVVEQTIRNRPSDGTERPVADCVYIGHGGYGLYA